MDAVVVDWFGDEIQTYVGERDWCVGLAVDGPDCSEIRNS